jgi:molybdopterin-containing oxidoreductase family molybdopterin binding subunit
MAERWVTTVCDRCYVGCGIKAHVVDEVVVGLEGDPDNPLNRGKMCAKGKAGIMAHYNPRRVKTPLKRTNPQKGIGVDPKWQEISYEEAIDTIADRLSRIKDEPWKLHVYTWGYDCGLPTLGMAIGTPHIQYAGAHECGKAIHPIEHMAAGGFHQQTDLHYCNYCIYVGTQGAVAARGSFTHIAKDLADARARGMRLVVVDPIGGYAAAKADEWVPIRPGTDAAFALAFINVMLNELGIYDAEFLKKGSNGPYLVAEDGLYLRDTASGKPLVFDVGDGVAKPYDDPTLKDPALEGSYQVQGVQAAPSFERLKRHVANFSPEWAEEITTVPAPTIRRLAREFGTAAQIGSTILLEGKELPYRPAALDWARGPQGHKHGFHHSWALKLINILIGNVNTPGGILSTGARGKNPYEWGPEGGVDGMLTHAGWAPFAVLQIPSSFPGRMPSKPERMDLLELFPLAGHATTLFPLAGAEPQKFGLDYRIEVALHNPSNLLMTTYADLKLVERFYGSIPFVAGYAVELNETNEAFDDIVLPMPTYLERQDVGANQTFDGAYSLLSPVGQDDWYLQVRPKVVEPPPGVKHPLEVVMDVAERAGIMKDLNKVMNQSLRFKEDQRLDPDRRYTLDEIHDRMLKSMFGPDKGLKWAKEHGVVRYHRDVEEAYPGPFMTARGIRLPIYLEHFPRKGEELQEVIQEMGLSWDFSDYKALPEWMPCDSFEGRMKGEYDLIGVHYKLAFIYGHYANENPWINEICERTPYTYPVLINEEVGRKKGLRDGDAIWVETPVRKVKAVAKLTQCVHPEVVGIAGHFGHWAQGMPVARGKGVAYNSLLPHTLDRIDKISTALDNCIPIKISKAEG